jgi:hypothetical protein
LAASTVGAVIAINTGLLGSGSLARIIADCVLAGLVVWFVIDLRQSRNGLQTPGPQDRVSPTHV